MYEARTVSLCALFTIYLHYLQIIPHLHNQIQNKFQTLSLLAVAGKGHFSVGPFFHSYPSNKQRCQLARQQARIHASLRSLNFVTEGK